VKFQPIFCAFVCFCLGYGSPLTGKLMAEEAAATAPVGKKIENFTLRDFRGQTVSLADFQDKQAVVVAFLGTECPLALQYAPRLTQLAARFADRGVAFVGINANQQDSLSEMAQYAKQHELTFPLLKDLGNVVADQLGAVRTPEVFVLDQERVVRYWGRIDDQFVVGRQRKAPTREDLAVALEETLAKQSVSQPTTPVQGCKIGRVHTPRTDATVTYSKHVAPLLNSRCVECHRPGEIAPFSLTSYADAAGWADTMLEVVEENRMPPWHANPEHGHFSNDRRLTDAQKQTLRDWVAAGAPEGNPADLPEPPKFVEGWQLPRVDQVVRMSDQSFHIPAEGTVDYKYFVVDPGFTEDKWIQGAECRPGNRGVVHHIIVLMRKGAGEGNESLASGFLTANAPGALPLLLPEGMAKHVPAGSKLIFQMHYTPNGSPQDDLSSIGLMFADPATVKQEVKTVIADTNMILIPPRVADYKQESSFTFRKDTMLLSFFPHMHLRGKSFRYDAVYPDGQRETLLDVPRYDFAWQQTYELAQPKLLPKGTRIRCIAHFDNSADNIANPNPNALVHWGEQTYDEMLMGFMDTYAVEATVQGDPKPAEPNKQADAQPLDTKQAGKGPAAPQASKTR